MAAKDLVKHGLWRALRWMHGADMAPLRVLAGPARGAILTLDVRSQTSYWIGTYDRYAFERLPFDRYLHAGDVAWDCGAFVGYYTAVFRRLVGDAGRVIVFEASSRNHGPLSRLPAANGWTNVEVRHAAVGPDHTELKFVANLGGESGPYELGRTFTAPLPLEIETVRCFGIDELVHAEGVARPAFLKLDLESAEEFALHNGPRTFEEGRPVILLELHGGRAHAAAARFLDRHRYAATPVHFLAGLREGPAAWLRSLREQAARSGRALLDLPHIPHMLLTLPLEHPDLNG